MRSLLMASVVGLSLAAPVAAQQVPAQLTLADALEIARERNPTYLQAVNTARSQGAQVRAGWGAFLPTVTANLSFNGNDSRTVTGDDDFGRAVELPMPIDIRRSSASQSVAARLTLFDGFNNLNSARASGAAAVAADASRSFAANRLDAETTGRFYEALRTRSLIALEDQLLESARQQLANTQRLFRVAAATQEDLLGAEADVANQELALDRARGEADKAKLAVREQLGLTEPIPFEVVGSLPDVWNPQTLSVTELIDRAVTSSPRVRQLEAQANVRNLQASAVRGARWPTISVNASYGRSVSLSSYDALFKFNPQNRGFAFGMSFDLPIFTGFQTSARIAQATADARNADQAARAGRLNVERLVRAAVIDVQNAYRGLELAQRSAGLSRERVRLGRERYAIGGIDFTNLQLLIDRSAQAERNVINARFQYAQAVVNLEEQVGGRVRSGQ